MLTENSEKIAIMGLSDHPDRYAFKAAQKLLKNHYSNLVGIHPSGETVLNIPVVPRPRDVKGPVHTVTMYVGPSKSALMLDEILGMKPRRIIFNPGSECPTLAAKARLQGVEVLEACTLVMLSISQF